MRTRSQRRRERKDHRSFVSPDFVCEVIEGDYNCPETINNDNYYKKLDNYFDIINDLKEYE